MTILKAKYVVKRNHRKLKNEKWEENMKGLLMKRICPAVWNKKMKKAKINEESSEEVLKMKWFYM
jgi:hypothetical protein